MRHPILIAAALLAGSPVATQAQPAPALPPTCPEGRLADGRCVNPVLARLARQQAVCFTQIKLSYIVCPGVLPGLDYRYKYPHTVVTERQREINILYERQGYQNVFGVTRATTRTTTR